VPELLDRLGVLLKPVRELVELRIPHADAAASARLHAVGQVLERAYDGDSARFKALVPPQCVAEFQPYLSPNGHAVK
jgi:50S ribosomal subunit-associated GTPase HflX